MRPDIVHGRYVELSAEEEAAQRLAESGAAPAAAAAGCDNAQEEGTGSTERVGSESGVGGGSGIDGDSAIPDDDDEPMPDLPRHLVEPIGSAAQVKVDEEVKGIESAINDSKGMPAYRGHWKNYNIYHTARYGEPAPRCPFTQLIYLDVTQATDFMRNMGSNGKSINQVPPSVHPSIRPDVIRHRSLEKKLGVPWYGVQNCRKPGVGIGTGTGIGIASFIGCSGSECCISSNEGCAVTHHVSLTSSASHTLLWMSTDDPSSECLELALEQASHLAKSRGQHLQTTGTTSSFEKGYHGQFSFQAGSASDTEEEAKNSHCR